MGVRPAGLDAVLISHFHGDHFGGIPFLFLESRYLEPRNRPLQVAGPVGTEAVVSDLARALYRNGAADPDPAQVRFLELADGQPTTVGPAEVRAFPVPHAEGEDCLGLDVRMDGRKVIYSGDTRWFPGLAKAARGADLLIWECTSATTEGDEAGGHTRLEDVLREHANLDCRRLLLVHMGPGVLEVAPGHDLPWAADGMTVPL
jgi:ribonuclease BN (tRNA processing enzyme)